MDRSNTTGTHAGAATEAAVIRAVAGTPGAIRRTRRGSFLVLVVGTLALLAVVAIIYVTIGNQDLRTRSAVARQERLAEAPRVAADYFAGVIASDRLATSVDSTDPLARDVVTGDLVATRENTDYPFTDPAARSDIAQPTAGAIPFDPAGRYTPPALLAVVPPAWIPSDPFLADARPTFVYPAGTDAPVPSTPADEAYLDNTSWGVISNFAPDGRFVNLFNLRGAFDAESGVGVGANGLPRMSQLLTTLEPDGSPRSTTEMGAPLDPNVPAHFSMRQLYAFRPFGSWDTTRWTPGDAAYIPYQWADADGDGFYDSRWFELRDARLAGLIADILPRDPTYRYFFAARAIDLSSKINVNTAGDFRAAPDQNVPAGARPSDVDLRRLLTMYDAYEMYATGPLSGYAGIVQPADANRFDHYGTITVNTSFMAGMYGYDALRMALAAGVIPPAVVGNNVAVTGAQMQARFEMYLGRTLTPTDWDFGAGPPAARLEFYDRRVRAELGAYLGAGSTFDARSGFDIASTMELLTRRGVNDAAFISNLERTIDGRVDAVADPGRRFGPVRSNRAPDAELARPLNNRREPLPEVLHLMDIDPRQHLTTISGAAPMRSYRGVPADRLVNADLGLDIYTALERIPTATGAINEPLNSIYRAYADALLPYSNIPQSWLFSAGFPAPPAPLARLAYGGRGALPGAITAAHMAVNLADSYDTDGRPRIAALNFNANLFDEHTSDPMNPPSAQLYPGAAGNTPNAAGNILYLSDERSGSNADSLPLTGVNIYGVEAQPFLTEVGTFTAYADADDDEGAGNNIDINGTLDRANDDFLYRGVFFQLTNPFSHDVVLSRDIWPTTTGQPWVNVNFYDIADPTMPEVDRESDFYYIRFGGRTYKLSALREQTYIDSITAQELRSSGLPAVDDDARIGQYIRPVAGDGLDITASGITIPAGRSIICYALTDRPQTILRDRIVPADPSLNSDTGWQRDTVVLAIQNAMRRNLSDDVDNIYWIGEVDATTGRYVFAPGVTGFIPSTIPGGEPVATLWRTVRSAGPAGTSELEGTVVAPPSAYWDGVTSVTTPAPSLFVRNIPENDQLIDRLRAPVGTDLDRRLPGGQNDVSGTDAGDPLDNGGFAITLWAHVRRPSDPALAGQVPRGALGAWCIEPKYLANWNFTEGYGPGSLSRGDFQGDGKGETLAEWRNSMRNRPLMESLSKHPAHTTGPTVNGAGRSNPAFPITSNYAALYPEIVIDNQQFSRTLTGPNRTIKVMRPADLILPFATGPMSNFAVPYTAPENRQNARWTTLSEAVAGSLGYDRGTPEPDDLSVLFWPDPAIADPGDVSPIAPHAFDRGNLRLDAFVPYLDLNSNGSFDAGADARLGAGIPLALTVPDAFTIRTGDLAPSLTRAEPGKINMNTMPVQVARCVPMLSPPPDSDPLGTPWWWWTGAGAMSQTSDVAATVVAYRDRNESLVRVPGRTVYPYERVSFVTPNADPLDYFSPNLAREGYTRIPAIRETPGMLATGELLAARFILDPSVPAQYAWPINIDYLGSDPANNSRVGVDSVLYPNPAGGTTRVTDTIASEYKEKLAIANAAMGSLTTRSDYFAVWFVVHGYQRSDAEGLVGDQPMVPSIARRFLMIVDRSRVTRAGEKPDVLLFKELPY